MLQIGHFVRNGTKKDVVDMGSPTRERCLWTQVCQIPNEYLQGFRQAIGGKQGVIKHAHDDAMRGNVDSQQILIPISPLRFQSLLDILTQLT